MRKVDSNGFEEREPWSWCETPEEKCTMNYCDENGCLNRKRNSTEQPPTAENAENKND